MVISSRRRNSKKAFTPSCEPLEGRQLLSSVTISPEEQLFVYMLNRARHDPVAYQQEQNLPVDLSYVTPRAPLAVNNALFGSAGFHAEEMATHNYFDHQSHVTGDWPNKMARDAGYPLPAFWSDSANYIESISAGTVDAKATLNALIVDAGTSPPGHRNALLGIDAFNADNREIGVGHAYSSSSDYGNYWAIHATRHDAADEFLTGVVYNDSNGNGRYDLNEGLANVTVSDGKTQATTSAQGGWSLPITDGVYSVSAFGSGFAGQATVPVEVQGQSVEVDFLSGVPTGQVDFKSVIPTILSEGTTTLKGTWTFDLETGTQGPPTGADIWWEQVDNVTRFLVPVDGSQLAYMGNSNFDAVSLETLKTQPYTSEPINGSNNSANQLTPGSVVAVKTKDGHYCKLEINSYGYNLGITWVTYAFKSVIPPNLLSEGTTTLKGTWTFDLETGTQGPPTGADIWWEQVDNVTRFLVPVDGSQLAYMGNSNFDAVSLETLKTQPYTSEPINGSNNSANQLTPGSVVAVKTKDGHYCKLEINSYGYNLGITWVTYA